MTRFAPLMLALLLACGDPSSGDGPPGAAGAGSDRAVVGACDTAFVFRQPLDSEEVLDAMRRSELRPVETRFSTEGAPDGSTGGSVGSPGHIGTVDGVERSLRTAAEMSGIDPVIIGIRVSGRIATDELGDLEDDVDTRTLVPSMAAVAISQPDPNDEAVHVVGGADCAGA